MILTPDEIRTIRQEAGHFPHPSAAAIEALNIAQEGHGWISDELLKEIAELLGMSPADLDSVATFYNLIYRRPVGRRVIHYCNSVSCWMLGAEDNCRHLSEKLGIGLGETTGDGEYTLLPIVCLGACDRAPVLMIGEETHFNVDPAKLDDILGDSGAP
ncbi:MAG: NADH-quinone oxidoreductase subunit NuoE [Pseudomonadota bacterium]